MSEDARAALGDQDSTASMVANIVARHTESPHLRLCHAILACTGIVLYPCRPQYRSQQHFGCDIRWQGLLFIPIMLVKYYLMVKESIAATSATVKPPETAFCCILVSPLLPLILGLTVKP